MKLKHMKARQTTTDNNKPIKQDPAPPVKALEGKGGERTEVTERTAGINQEYILYFLKLCRAKLFFNE